MTSAPTPHPLDDSRAKIERAKNHLRDLMHDAATWMANATMSGAAIEIEKAPDPARPGTIDLLAKNVPVTDPFRWGLYFGDIVQNLRGALDHLAFALADKDSPGRGEDRDTQFIIVPDAAGFQKASWHLKHLSQPHKDLIEAEQPYVRQPADVAIHPLSMLEHYSNIDKHRVIHIVAFGSDLFSWGNPTPFRPKNAKLTSQAIYENPLGEGVKLMTVTVEKDDPNGPAPDIELESVLFAPTLALGPGMLVKHVGPNLIRYVAEVVERFAGQF